MLPLVRALSRSRGLLLSLGFLVLALAGFIGCGKTDSSPAAAKLQTPDARPLLKFHWLGKHRLSTEANATNFMAIWNLPESARLEAQTLDKLASAPWRLWQTNVAVSNAPTALLRPLLEDLVNHEVYVEAQGETNVPPAFVLALRLPADRFALWQTNLPPILSSLFATNFAPSGPSAIFQLPSATLTLSRSNDWTLLSFTPSPHRGEGRGAVSASPPDPLLAAFCARLATGKNPFPELHPASRASANPWVEVDVQLPALVTWLISKPQTFGVPDVSRLPALSLLLFGESGHVRTRATLTVATPPHLPLDPWIVPTNLVYDPIIGFSACRGLRSVLPALGCRAPQTDVLPDQLYLWSQQGNPALHFFAFPSANPNAQFASISNFLLSVVNPLVGVVPGGTNTWGKFEAAGGENHLLKWRGMPYIFPNASLLDLTGGKFITGGMFANRFTNQPAPPALFDQLVSDSDLVLYQWEDTAANSFGLIQVAQALRLVFGAPRLSLTNNASLGWLVAISPKLETTSTAVRAPESLQMNLTRSSVWGFLRSNCISLPNGWNLPISP